MRAPYYSDGAIRLYHGDARELLPELAGAGERITREDLA